MIGYVGWVWQDLLGAGTDLWLGAESGSTYFQKGRCFKDVSCGYRGGCLDKSGSPKCECFTGR
jgi:hypothetical protein